MFNLIEQLHVTTIQSAYMYEPNTLQQTIYFTYIYLYHSQTLNVTAKQ